MKCWCCEATIPDDVMVQLCKECMDASVGRSMQIWCSLHDKRLVPAEISR